MFEIRGEQVTTLMVVDDTAFMRDMVKGLAKECGIEVVGEAENGLQAVELYRQLKPDVVTMDITMPVMSGLEATKIIIDEFPTAKVIVITALGQQKMVIQALNNGAKDFLAKPFGLAQFQQIFRQLEVT
ncbi:MAG: response regulator [Kurthia sp.]|nr:response regulator [Candidatus Kurthia equi]